MVTGTYKLKALEGAACPEGLRRCLSKAAAFDPKDRYSTAGEFERALSAALKKPRRRWGIIAAAACLAAALGLFLCLFQRNRSIEFDNALLEQAVRYELDKPSGSITYEDLDQVERLAVVGRNVLEREQNYRYGAFGYIDNVPQLDEPYGNISDLSLLEKMPNLRELYLCQQEITDLSPLENLPLRALYLTDNRIEDLTPLSEINNLQILYLGNNRINDLSPLPEMDSLASLSVGDFQGQDLDGLNLPQLAILSLSFHVNSLEGIDQTEALEWLNLSALEELSLEPLTRLKGLTNLSLNECHDMDYTPLLRVPGLENVEIWDEACLQELERDCPEDVRTFQVTRP